MQQQIACMAMMLKYRSILNKKLMSDEYESKPDGGGYWHNAIQNLFSFWENC